MNGRIHVCEEFDGQILKSMSMEETSADVDVVAMMVKASDGTWRLKGVDVRADRGQNLSDILEPTVGNLIRSNIEGAPAEQKAFFDTVKDNADHELDDRHRLRRLCFTVEAESDLCYPHEIISESLEDFEFERVTSPNISLASTLLLAS
eukprot:TRINITY_DN4236_c0_g2_i5.p1 TRINITY_DN4236_c0_g2~~TRINITY_DN4236_c0_g2_i5.p1  ORF type:complete len:149 (+),score=30.70 TRINITY_DN4236_c0_g2_i5:170-616(+)